MFCRLTVIQTKAVLNFCLALIKRCGKEIITVINICFYISFQGIQQVLERAFITCFGYFF